MTGKLHSISRARSTLHVQCWRTILLAAVLCLCALILPQHAKALETLTLEETIKALAFLQDRSPGTPGAKHAATLVERNLTTAFTTASPAMAQKVTTGRHSFLLPSRVLSGATIHIKKDRPHHTTVLIPEDVPEGFAAKGVANGNSKKAYPLFPLRMHALSPTTIPEKGLDGRVLYVGKGNLQDFNGMEPSGAIVLMDIDSGKNWQNAAMLGAGALIFIDDENRGTPFRDKFELTPIAFPRFWMPFEQAEELFGPLDSLNEAAPTAHVSVKTQWQRTTSENIWAFIPGTDVQLQNEYLLVEAFYDAPAFVAGKSPAADAAVSIATLLHLARHYAAHPPKRSVLLLATAGYGQEAAGMREFTWTLTTKKKHLAELATLQHERLIKAQRAVAILQHPTPLTYAASAEAIEKGETELLRSALYAISKDRVSDISTQLMRLRLQVRTPEISDKIKSLAALRLQLRRLKWIASSLRSREPISVEERELTASLLPDALTMQQNILREAKLQANALQSSVALRDMLNGKTLRAGFSLHLSSHGTGVGAFERGWMYELKKNIKRTRFLGPLDETLKTITKTMGTEAALWNNTLRPSRTTPWESYLPDNPHLSVEPLALAGFPAVSLATLNDLRPLWGTPHDTPGHVDIQTVQAQSTFITALLANLADTPLPALGKMKSGFATLEGRANRLRQGEVFPDRPATDTVVLAFQGPARLYGMVNAAGTFRIPGVVLRKQTVHKAVLEAFTFDPSTGMAVHAVDKPITGKANYRVKIRRSVMPTDLTLFDCAQTTLFSMLETRTLSHLYRPEIIDARTEAQPLRYWYSRMDTRESSLGTLFLEPDVPFKLTLSDTVLGKKMLLLNGSNEHPLGRGFAISHTPVIPLTEYRAAKDMWTLLTPRINNLEAHGIINERIRDLHERGRAALQQANTSFTEKQWDALFSSTREALSLASLVYNDVDSTQRDVLTGVLFYIALFIPFAYCMERLLIGSADINRRIGGFLAILLTTIVVIHSVHPAFQLTYSPTVVILAFFIIGLSALVSLIIIFRFEREMQELQRRSMHVKSSEISKWSAFSAAMVIGVSNLRRRPIRTVLTITTLTILTFTIMNFTAAQSIRKEGWVNFSDTAPYNGLLVKQLRWKTLPPESLQVMSDMFGAENVAPRVWKSDQDLTKAPVIPLQAATHQTDTMHKLALSKRATLRAIIGLSHTEAHVSGFNTMLTAGSWFTPQDRHAMILPEAIAAKLGITPADFAVTSPKIVLWGIPFTVRGLLRDDAFEQKPDLDGEPTTPIIYPNEAATQLSEVEAEAIAQGADLLRYESRYEHISGAETAIIPAATLLAAGGEIKAIAVAKAAVRTTVSPSAPKDGRTTSTTLPEQTVQTEQTEQTEQAQPASAVSSKIINLGDRFGTMLFSGSASGTSLYYASNATSYAGVSTILIPLAISVLIVLNTMIGSVHERRGEIGIYTSVGLAPSHVAFLFVAEALAFAIISVVLGYLVAQLSAGLLAGTPLWAGMTANYSSTAGIAAMLLVIAVVLISVIYPAQVASEIAIPDVTRTWTLPEPVGNTMSIVLPFLIKTTEQACAGGYLMEYYNAHRDISHGAFATESVACSFIPPEDLPGHGILSMVPPQELLNEDICFTMELTAWLAPFDFGVRQQVKLIFCPSDLYKGFKQIRVQLTREAGEQMMWQNLNKRFLNSLRKQLLVWRSLDTESRKHYEEELEHALAAEGILSLEDGQNSLFAHKQPKDAPVAPNTQPQGGVK